MNRTLRLRREKLTELSQDDLRAVDGAGPRTLPLGECLFNTNYGTCTCCTASHSCE